MTNVQPKILLLLVVLKALVFSSQNLARYNGDEDVHTPEEIQSWENETAFAQRHNKKFIDPRKEKLKDHRKGIKSTHYNKESKPDRKHDYRLYKNQNEASHAPRAIRSSAQL